MQLLNSLKNHFKSKHNEAYSGIYEDLLKWSEYMSSVLQTDGVIDRSVYKDAIAALYSLAAEADQLSKRRVLFSDDLISSFLAKNNDFQTEVKTFEERIKQHNSDFLKTLADNARKEIGSIEGHDLDDQQIMCILKNAHNHCVIAGAGTGKTTTIIGKVKYLVEHDKVDPKDILILSYTRAAALEMRERLKKNTSQSFDVSTFHSFAYSILTCVEKKKPEIFSDPIRTILKPAFDESIRDPKYLKKVINYIYNAAGAGCTDLDQAFNTPEEYQKYIKKHRPVTFNHETVKSYGELKIANALAANGIRYIYEMRYEHDTATEEYAQYHPDFYLPDHGIYIEYYAIDRKGNVPAWFEGDDPTKRYLEGIKWKRLTHKEHNTKLIECYAYEDQEGVLIENLENKLKDAGVELKPISADELLRSKNDRFHQLINAFLSSAGSIITLARNKRLSADELFQAAGTSSKAKNIAEIVYPLQRKYEAVLKDRGLIDFADMLNRAEKYISEGAYKNHYRHVIVDEYQDITASQYRLLKAMRQSCDFDLFCVGDDWQSIYRFNGSDVSYIMDFESFWGSSELSRIETTYRFAQSLIDVSGHFIMKNPRQIKKNIRSGLSDSSFAVSKIEGYNTQTAIQFMTDRLQNLPKNSTVFLIGRYNFDLKLLDAETRLTVRFETSTQDQHVICKNRPDLDIIFITAHRSKGLQADYVFILNNTDGALGFPSNVEDNPLTSMLLEHSENFTYAEERRLFYVALTRARKHVYLLTVKNKESTFEQELEDDHGQMIRNETYICPVCGGRLSIIDGQYGKFFGCENYKTINCRFMSPIQAGRSSHDQPV